MSNLTPKQERFCQEYVRTGNKSEAYRLAYDAENMLPETIHEKSSRLSTTDKVRTRIQELQGEMKDRFMYSLSESVQKDLRLIERYEAALEILENPEAPKKEVEVAQRVIRYIGATGYSSAQERLSKQGGFFDKDNRQKAPDINISPIEWSSSSNDSQ